MLYKELKNGKLTIRDPTPQFRNESGIIEQNTREQYACPGVGNSHVRTHINSQYVCIYKPTVTTTSTPMILR
jgi:hypothetical protein